MHTHTESDLQPNLEQKGSKKSKKDAASGQLREADRCFESTDLLVSSKRRGSRFESQTKLLPVFSLYTVSEDEMNSNRKVYIDHIVVSGHPSREFGGEGMTRFPGALRYRASEVVQACKR